MDKAVKLNVRATKLKSHMQLEFKKPGLSTRHIRYIMQKVKVKDTDNEDLEVFLAAIEDEGGSVEVLMDQDNNDARRTRSMRQGRKESSCTFLHRFGGGQTCPYTSWVAVAKCISS